jgi:protein disulfide-isomerase A6
MIVAQTSDTQKAVVKEFNVDKYPTLVMLPGGSAPGVVYSGPTERDPIYKFLSEYALVAISDEKPLKGSSLKAKQDPLGMYNAKLCS